MEQYNTEIIQALLASQLNHITLRAVFLHTQTYIYGKVKIFLNFIFAQITSTNTYKAYTKLKAVFLFI